MQNIPVNFKCRILLEEIIKRKEVCFSDFDDSQKKRLQHLIDIGLVELDHYGSWSRESYYRAKSGVRAVTPSKRSIETKPTEVARLSDIEKIANIHNQTLKCTDFKSNQSVLVITNEGYKATIPSAFYKIHGNWTIIYAEHHNPLVFDSDDIEYIGIIPREIPSSMYIKTKMLITCCKTESKPNEKHLAYFDELKEPLITSSILNVGKKYIIGLKEI